MERSEQINELAAALAKAQGEMSGAAKDTANPHFKHNYADLASVWDACRGPLAKYGLSVLQFPRTEYIGAPEFFEWTSRSGEKRTGVKVLTTVSVVTRLMHASGQFFEDSMSTVLPSGDPQAVGSAITYLRRYALQSIVGVAPEDDDGEAAQGRGNGRAAQPAAAQSNAMPPILVAPKGYQEWSDALVGKIPNGMPALEDFWKNSNPEYRRFMVTYYAAEWAAMKRAAADSSREVNA